MAVFATGDATVWRDRFSESKDVMTDTDAFHRAIAAAPDDDAPRLVYADWLEENGEDHKGQMVRWWTAARHTLANVKPTKGKAEFAQLEAASKELFAIGDRSAVVLASFAVHCWQERLYPVDWEKIRPHYADVDGLRKQIETAWQDVEFAGLGLLPIEAIEAAGRSANAAWNSAYAAWNSADAVGSSTYAAWSSAYAAWSSTNAAGSSAQDKLIRIAVSVYRSPVWATMPGANVRAKECVA